MKMILDVVLNDDADDPAVVAEGLFDALMEGLDLVQDVPGLDTIDGYEIKLELGE